MEFHNDSQMVNFKASTTPPIVGRDNCKAATTPVIANFDDGGSGGNVNNDNNGSNDGRRCDSFCSFYLLHLLRFGFFIFSF